MSEQSKIDFNQLAKELLIRLGHKTQPVEHISKIESALIRVNIEVEKRGYIKGLEDAAKIANDTCICNPKLSLIKLCIEARKEIAKAILKLKERA